MDFPIETVYSKLEREVSNYRAPIVDLIALQTNDPFKVLVATILSARTKDDVTTAACSRLFAKAPDLSGLEQLTQGELEKIIYPVGFFRNKARYLSQLPSVLKSKFHSQVPDTIESLLQLPGVGRKTANLVMVVAFKKPAICVDTHVHRIMNIWGYVNTDTPYKTEIMLRKKLPKMYWLRINSILVAFGQVICKPVRPHCDKCVIAEVCPQLGVVPRKIPAIYKSGLWKKNDIINIVSWNVNGLRAVIKKGFFDFFTALDPDIFALQEIKTFPEQLSDEAKDIKGYSTVWYPAVKKGYSGTAVFSKIEPVDVIYGLGINEFDREGRVLTLEFNDFFLVNAYFPNAQAGLKRLEFKRDFNKNILLHLDRLSWKKSVIVCGDFNVAHKPIDLANPEANVNNPGYTALERAWMDEVIGAGYIDTFRMFDHGPGRYTWWSYSPGARIENIGWRIDYIIVDPGSKERVMDASIHDDIGGSDHCPVSLKFT